MYNKTDWLPTQDKCENNVYWKLKHEVRASISRAIYVMIYDCMGIGASNL